MSRFYRPKGSPRYGFKRRKECLGGCGFIRKHDSAGEADYCNTLKLLQRAGTIQSYAAQKIYWLRDRLGARHGYLRPDFIVTLNDGSVEIREFKDRLLTKEWELKSALFTFCYPEIEYKVVYPKDCL